MGRPAYPLTIEDLGTKTSSSFTCNELYEVSAKLVAHLPSDPANV